MSSPIPPHPLPTHAQIATFFRTHLFSSLGPDVREIPFLYHTPRHHSYTPSTTTQPISSVVLSITPTPGFYSRINRNDVRSPAAAFLHRPWKLERRQVRAGSWVLASHVAFDEHLTVGWNVGLARRLGLEVEGAVCVRGYKGEEGRRIGLVARVDRVEALEVLAARVKSEFAGVGELYRSEAEVRDGEGGVRLPKMMEVVAIMNAFHEDEVKRVLEVCIEKGWVRGEVNEVEVEVEAKVTKGKKNVKKKPIRDADGAVAEDLAQNGNEMDERKKTELRKLIEADGSSILYLTGAARDYGLEAIKKYGMPAFCVGHRACEEWGIRYLASELRKQWPGLDVVEVLEEGEPPPRKIRSQQQDEGGKTGTHPSQEAPNTPES